MIYIYIYDIYYGIYYIDIYYIEFEIQDLPRGYYVVYKRTTPIFLLFSRGSIVLNRS